MIRPCFLVIDREFPGSISTRKLVIETAKFNVLTAYSGVEAREMFERFPAINGAVLDAGIEDVPCASLVHEFKIKRPSMPVIMIGAPGSMDCPEADYRLESFLPSKLLDILRSLMPKETEIIEQRNEDLSREQLS
ncbi:response regulator [Granulicella arctica]|uniref:response regulator n=1 Tax=Granulicella arctica TaxID=940613 RepID=UPI0021DFF3F5|nr:response regulator [Granulicella arctica]